LPAFLISLTTVKMGASSNPHATSILPLLLQKPSLKSKNREHVKYMNERMEW